MLSADEAQPYGTNRATVGTRGVSGLDRSLRKSHDAQWRYHKLCLPRRLRDLRMWFKISEVQTRGG